MVSIGLTGKVMRQAGRPTGLLGRLVAMSMNIGHSQVTRWGLSHVSINEGDIILDVGCGGGKTVNVLTRAATRGKVYGIDYSKASIAVARRTNRKFIGEGRTEILQASVASLPFPDNLFNLITAVETYYFWPDIVKSFAEIRRVLKPGGSVLLINEAYRDDRFEKRNAKWARLIGLTCYLPEEFREFLHEAGYSSVQVEVFENENWIAVIGRKDEISNNLHFNTSC